MNGYASSCLLPPPMPIRFTSLSCIFRNIMLVTSGLLLMLTSMAFGEQPSPMGEPRIQGRPISEWRERMKGLDPSGPLAAENVPPLIELIQSESIPEFTRRQAAITLGRIGKPAADAVPVLRKLLAETDSDSTRLWI